MNGLEIIDLLYWYTLKHIIVNVMRKNANGFINPGLGDESETEY